MAEWLLDKHLLHREQVQFHPHKEGLPARVTIAAENSWVDVLGQLIQLGEDVNKKRRGEPPLHAAAIRGQLEAVRKLLSLGADIDCTDNDDETPLYGAVFDGKSNVALHLIDAGANIHIARNPDKSNPLHSAAYNGDVAVARALLQKGADVNAVAERNRTALYYAVIKDHVKMAELLLQYGADCSIRGRLVKTQNESGRTALHTAAEAGSYAIVNLLLHRDPSLRDTKDKYSNLPIHLATLQGHKDCIGRLACPENLDSLGFKSRTPLLFACLNGHLHIVRYLLERGVRVNIEDDNGSTPLTHAIQNKHIEVANTLLDHHADPTVGEISGCSSLHLAV
ncbi:ankyrin repeat-containing domain protein, partial [Cercophora newfieldiana]